MNENMFAIKNKSIEAWALDQNNLYRSWTQTRCAQNGRGNLIKRAEEMKTLGAKTNKSLPDNLLEIPQIETKDSTI